MSTHISKDDLIAAAITLADAVLTFHHESHDVEDEDADEAKAEFNYDHMLESAIDLINMVLAKHYTEHRGSHLTPPQVLHLLSRAAKQNNTH